MSRALIELLTYDNPVLRNFCFWSVIMLMKMILMSILTGAQRYRTKKCAKGISNEIKVPIGMKYFTATKLLFWLVGLLHSPFAHNILRFSMNEQLWTFANPEDAGKNNECSVNEKVERVRRAHLNDMENILPLVLISFIYVLTDPIPAVAVNIFRVVTAARIWHTIVYAIVVIPQPARAIGFFIPYIAMFYMAVQSAIVFFN